MTSKPTPPNQPVVGLGLDAHFLPNLVVVKIASARQADLRPLLSGTTGRFSEDDARQFQQLLGIRLVEYQQLPYVHVPLEPFTIAQKADPQPFEPVLESYSLGQSATIDAPLGYKVTTRRGEVPVPFNDLRDASRHYGKAYAKFLQECERVEDDGPRDPGYCQPLQPLYYTGEPVRHLRFRANDIVRYLLDHGPFDLNNLARMSFPREDYMQFMQLIGYSLSGYGELSFVTDESFDVAERWIEANGVKP